MSAPATPVTDVEISIGLRRAVVGVVLMGAAIVLGILIAVEVDPLDIDTWWNGGVSTWAPGLAQLAFGLDFVGGGWVATYVVPIGGALLLVVLRKPWSGLCFLVASGVSAGLVQVLKSIFGRVRPEEMLVISDHGSYPSGHTANAATIAVVAVILFPRVWVAVLGGAWVFVMAFSRTQVHAHWLSDTLGGAMFGAGAALVVTAIFTVPLLKERSLG